MEFFNKIPVMDRTALRELKKGIDLSFKEFSRAYGEAIESFFDPLLYFLIWLEKILVSSPWPIVIGVFGVLAWIASRSIKLVIGTVLLLVKVNMLTGFLALLTAFLYTLVYTPLKSITWLNTSIGSIPGALPIVGGWTAAKGEIETMAWVLFGIMYLWQHPHFYAIAWICKEDYSKANYKMLPVIDSTGNRTIRQIFWHLILMIPISLLPVFLGSMGIFYLLGVTIITCAFFISAIPLARNQTIKSALILLKASVFYLPALLIIIIIDLKL